MSSASEKYIATTLFKLKIHQFSGQQFEDFFVDIMRKSNPLFEAVKAYGNTGDKKNDGFIKSEGIYYQVFSPDDITKSATITEAVKKLKTDFAGLYDHWNAICPIKKYYFVINDKYKGVPPQIHEAALELANDGRYSSLEPKIFVASDLQRIFDTLTEDDKQDIIGFIPDENMPILEYDALQQAVEYIMKADLPMDYDDNLVVPDFEEKIQFNALSPRISVRLTAAGYQEGLLANYFRNNPGSDEVLQKKFHALYEQSILHIPDNQENANDQRFIYILDAACPQKSAGIRTSVLVLMAYYFDSCDIFEKPE